jgi:hypothetical protein
VLLLLGLVAAGLGGAAMASDAAAGAVLAVVGIVVMLGSVGLSVQGIGQAAAAIHTRGNHLILATTGLVLSSLHAGMLIGVFCISIWQS